MDRSDLKSVRTNPGTLKPISPPKKVSPDRPETARTRLRWLSMAVLALLMAGTSWAVASWVSAWLVPPYLILMALLLSPPTWVGRPEGDPARAEGNSSSLLGSDESDDDDDPSSEDPASADRSGDGSESEPESEGGAGLAPKSPKARRGKSRGRKGKPLPEPTEANWLQVAPGKFVRVEAVEEGSSSLAEPHAFVGIPVEPSTSPPMSSTDDFSPLEPIEDVGPGGFEPFEAAWEGDPTGMIESGSSTDLEAAQKTEPFVTLEEASAVDGNAPQAEASFEAIEAEPPEGPSEAVEDRAVIGDDCPSPRPFADVPPELDDDGGAPSQGLDPTEIPVDETDLDDADPSEEPLLLPSESPRDAELSATEPLPSDTEIGPLRGWPWRLAPRVKVRVGHPPLRRVNRSSPPGRIERPRREARRPPDPRRFERRGLRRPRQVNRSFPPRSPPLLREKRSGVGGR